VTNRFGRYSWLLLLILAAGIQWQCGKKEAAPGVTAAPVEQGGLVVKTVLAARRDWVVRVPVTGTLRSLSTVDVKPEVGGRLIATYFQEGDYVRKNQLLAEIDPVNYRLAYDQAEAALQVALAGLDRAKVAADHARTEKERADNLLKSGGITEKDHQAALTGIKDAESQVRLAEAQCAQARASLAVAEKALKDCSVFSPADGHIQKRYFDKGSLLSPGIALYSIVDNDRLELECVIPSYQLAKVRIGQRATFVTPAYGEQQFDGTVSAINPEVEAESRSVTVKLKISNPRGFLRSGMYGRGDIVASREANALVIPRDCLIAEKEGSDAAGVYVIREGKARRLDILIGDSYMEDVWVRQGLQEGDVVISEIGPSIKDGIAVRAAQ
jgi:membrane fusion protein (multidrug efflux system)